MKDQCSVFDDMGNDVVQGNAKYSYVSKGQEKIDYKDGQARNQTLLALIREGTANTTKVVNQGNKIVTSKKIMGYITDIYKKDGKRILHIDEIAWNISGVDGDIFINNNPAIKTFEVSKDALVYLVPYNFESFGLQYPPQSSIISGQLEKKTPEIAKTSYDLFEEGMQLEINRQTNPFVIELNNNVVTKIEQVFRL